MLSIGSDTNRQLRIWDAHTGRPIGATANPPWNIIARHATISWAGQGRPDLATVDLSNVVQICGRTKTDAGRSGGPIKPRDTISGLRRCRQRRPDRPARPERTQRDNDPSCGTVDTGKPIGKPMKSDETDRRSSRSAATASWIATQLAGTISTLQLWETATGQARRQIR